MKNFEDFLKDKHAEQYHGLDDNMSDDFDRWLEDLDGSEYMAYAEEALTAQTTEMIEKLETIRAKAHNGKDVYTDIVSLIQSFTSPDNQ
jgi:hypothetical protein